MKNEIYLTLEESINYLEDLDNAGLQDWIAGFFIQGKSHPIFFDDERNTRTSFLMQLQEHSKFSSFKDRFKEAIANIYENQPIPEKNDAYFFKQILILVGVSEVRGLFNKLLKTAIDEQFKDITISKQSYDIADLHCHLLKTLFGMVQTTEDYSNIMPIVKRDISNPQYMLPCFRILYESPLSVQEKHNMFASQHASLLEAEIEKGNISGDFKGALKRYKDYETARYQTKI